MIYTTSFLLPSQNPKWPDLAIQKKNPFSQKKTKTKRESLNKN